MAFIEAGPRVAETSSTTGTGTLTLTGAINASRERFNAVCADGDTVPYWVLDETDQWEFGIGTYSANTLARTTRLGSSTGLAISFVANKTVFLGYQGMGQTLAYATTKSSLADADKLGVWDSVTGKLRSVLWSTIRLLFPNILTADLTLHVETTGNDTTGTGSVGAPFLTAQRAWDEACKYTLTGDAKVIIEFGVGSFGPMNCVGGPSGNAVPPGTYTAFKWTVLVQGQGSTTVFDGFTGGTYAQTLSVGPGGKVGARNMKFEGTANGPGAHNGGIFEILDGVEFGDIDGAGILCNEGGIVYRYTDYTISGGGGRHMYAWGNAYIEGGASAVTLTGTPAFGKFVESAVGSMVIDYSTYTGAATGTRFDVNYGGRIVTETNDLNYFPGNAAGTFGLGGGSYDDHLSHRKLLTSNLTLWVRTDGDDANDGSADSAGGAFLTFGRAFAEAMRYDKSNYGVTIKVGGSGAGRSFTGVTYVSHVDMVLTDAYTIVIEGDTVTPSNVEFDAIYVFNSLVNIKGVHVGVVTADGGAAYVNITNSIVNQVATHGGGRAFIDTGVTIVDNAAHALYADDGGSITVNSAPTVSGTPAYSDAFASAWAGGKIIFNALPTGSATGSRYNCDGQGYIYTGAGATALPGNAAGTETGGGVYQ